MKHILSVVSEHPTMGNDKHAGCYIPELVQPYYPVRERDIKVDCTAPDRGGPAIVGADVKDPELVKLLTSLLKVHSLLLCFFLIYRIS